MTKKSVAIIGGGFSGIAVAYNLLQANIDIRIDIFDDEDFKNHGKAYETCDENHILNVPADKMGLPYDAENHFYLWLKNKLPDLKINGNDFVYRGYYRLYLQEIVADLKTNPQINFINQKISEVNFVNQKYILTSIDKIFGEYDNVVLACGLPIKPLTKDFVSDRIVENIWEFFNKSSFPKSGNILIIGTGLTMVDVALSLKNKGFEGRIIACSKSGKLPLSHPKDRAQIVPSLEIADANLPLSLLVRKLRKIVAQNNDWQSVLYSLRPITSQLWQKFDLTKKQRFLRHLMSFWSIHRHRVASSNYQKIMEMINSGKLEIVRGKFERFEQKNNGIIAKLKSGKNIEADFAINATGFDFAGKTSELITDLLNKKIIINHNTNLGFATDSHHPNFYLAGALLTGELLEITAVPELRTIAHKISLEILR